MKSLDGKVAIVTGASSKRGMGHAVALRFAREGADVVVIDKVPAPRSLFPGDEGWGGLNEIVTEVESLGQKGLALVADLSSSQEVDKTVAGAVEKFGKIDILVHCAAIRGPVGTPVTELDEEEWRKILEVNLTGAFLVSKAVAKSMVSKGQGGKIVHIASLAGTRGVPGSAAYCASKWGVIGLVKTMGIELAPHNINVNAINPGGIITNLRDETFAHMAQEQGISWEEARDRDWGKMIAGIPMGRLGTADEIADLVFFLASDQSSYITGETVNISGGIG
jgi:NAD(P)-dependent dehydrogenase (short-subunit alcohol dehydrogenase family)